MLAYCLDAPKEIYIGELLHSLDIGCLSDFLIVEKNPDGLRCAR